MLPNTYSSSGRNPTYAELSLGLTDLDDIEGEDPEVWSDARVAAATDEWNRLADQRRKIDYRAHHLSDGTERTASRKGERKLAKLLQAEAKAEREYMRAVGLQSAMAMQREQIRSEQLPAAGCRWDEGGACECGPGGPHWSER